MAATAAAANASSTLLTPVAGLPTFADVFGSAGTRLVEYEMDDGTRYECGHGTINLATLTLTRDNPLNTFDASAAAGARYSASSPARINSFASGVTVRCAPLATSFQGGDIFSMGPGIGNGYVNLQTDVNYTAQLEGWRNFLAYLWTGSRPIKSVSIFIRSTMATGKMRVGLMEVSPSGVMTLIREFTENSQFDLTLSGPQTISNFSPLLVPPGPYVLQFVPYDTSGSGRPGLAGSQNHFSDRCGLFGRTGEGRVNNNMISDAGANTLATSKSIASAINTNYSYTPLFTFGI